MGKLIDIKDTNIRESLRSEITSVGETFGDEYGCTSGVVASKEMIGLCHDCTNLEGVRTEYEHYYLHCSSFDRRLPTLDKIRVCTRYYKRGMLDLCAMTNIAYIIEISKDKIGFK